MNSIVNEQKLGFIDIVSEGMKILFFKFRDISLIALCSIVPTSLLIVFSLQVSQLQSAKVNILAIFSALFLIYLLQGVFSLVASMSIAVIVEKVVTKEEISLAEAVKYATTKLGKAISTSLYVLVIVLGLMLLLIIPGIIYSNYYIFVLYVVALRNKSGGEALDYSKMLVEGQWWRLFGILFGAALIFTIPELIITYTMRLISENPYYAVIPNFISLFLNTIFGTLTVVLFLNNDFVYHHRLAKRKEMEKLRRIKKAPSIEEYVEKNKKRKAKSLTAKKVVRKPIKKATPTTVTKKRTSQTKK